MNNIINIKVITNDNGTLSFVTDTPHPVNQWDTVPAIRMHIDDKAGFLTPKFEFNAFAGD